MSLINAVAKFPIVGNISWVHYHVHTYKNDCGKFKFSNKLESVLHRRIINLNFVNKHCCISVSILNKWHVSAYSFGDSFVNRVNFCTSRNNSTNSLTRPWLNTKNLCLYRTLHVLNCVQNETCSEILWPVAQQVLATIHTLTNVLAIKCFHKLQMPVPILLLMSTCAFASFEKTAVKGAADVYEVSDKFRQGICRQASRRGRTIGRSIRCLRIQVGAAYYFKMSTFNTFMRTVVELTINVMLTLF